MSIRASYSYLLFFSAVVCANGDLRLAGSANVGQGRVEICINETWGTVCDDSWDVNDAAVACQALGFSRFSEQKFVDHVHECFPLITMHII